MQNYKFEFDFKFVAAVTGGEEADKSAECFLVIVPEERSILAFDKKVYTATHCNTLQHTATHCNTLQHIITDSPAQSSVKTSTNLQNAFQRKKIL